MLQSTDSLIWQKSGKHELPDCTRILICGLDKQFCLPWAQDEKPRKPNKLDK